MKSMAIYRFSNGAAAAHKTQGGAKIGYLFAQRD